MSSKKIIKGNKRPQETSSPKNERLRGRIPVHLQDNVAAQAAYSAEKLAEAGEKAAEVLAEAEEQAEDILAQARAESEALREQAREAGRSEGYQAGYQAGHAKGKAAAEAEIRGHLHTVYQLADEAAKAKATTIAEAETGIVELVIDVTRKVIGEMVELNPEIVVNVVSNALEEATNTDVLTIRANPQDVELLREYWENALGDNPGNRQWEIMADRRVKRGGCVIDTQAGSVDAQIDTQLVQIKYAFKPELVD